MATSGDKIFPLHTIESASKHNEKLYKALHTGIHTLFIEYFSDQCLAFRFDSHLNSVYFFWNISEKETPRQSGLYRGTPLIAIRETGETLRHDAHTIASFGFPMIGYCNLEIVLSLFRGDCGERRFRSNLTGFTFRLPQNAQIFGFRDWM